MSRKAKNGANLSYSGLCGYRSAIRFLYTEADKEFPKEMEIAMQKHFNFKGLKRRDAKERANSTRKIKEGKEPLPFELYKWLGRYFLRDVDAFSHCYLTMAWNLCCRTVNCEGIMIEHLSWTSDSLTVHFAITKTDQEGEQSRIPRHVYANPLCPEICPILALGWYLASIGNSFTSKSQLFPGSSQSERFSKSLKQALRSDEGREEMDKYGLKIDEIGVHSLRKRVPTHITCGSTTGPSIVAISLRMGWSLRRDTFTKKRPETVTWVVVQRAYLRTTRLSLFPPHPTSIILLNLTSLTLACLRDVEGMEPVRQYCVSSLAHHSKFLEETVKPTHALFQTHLFRCRERRESVERQLHDLQSHR